MCVQYTVQYLKIHVILKKCSHIKYEIHEYNIQKVMFVPILQNVILLQVIGI